LVTVTVVGYIVASRLFDRRTELISD